MRQAIFKVMLTASCLLAVASPGWAGEAEWKAHMEAGQVALGKGDLAGMEKHFSAAVQEAEITFGGDHPSVATSLVQLGLANVEQGRLIEAETLFKRSLAIRENILGPNHLDVASVIHNLGLTYALQGRFDEAEEQFKRAIDMTGKLTYAEDIEIAPSLAGLGSVYQKKGRYADAEVLMKRALVINEKHFGPNSSEITTSLNNLGTLLAHIGRLTEAEQLLKRAYAIDLDAFGPDHPAMATYINNLVAIFDQLGRNEKTEALLAEALRIAEKKFGPEHPKTATILGHFAAAEKRRRRFAEAEAYYKRVLEIRERVFGPEHPEVAETLVKMAMVAVDGAAASVTTLDSSHPEFKQQAMRVFDSLERMTALFLRAINILKMTYGPDHPELAEVWATLAQYTAAMGKREVAQKSSFAALEIIKRAYGPDHVRVAENLRGQVNTHVSTGRINDAIAPMREAKEILAVRWGYSGETSRRNDRAEQRKWTSFFEQYVRVLGIAGPAAGKPEAVASESFEVAQWARASDTAEQVAKMAARHAAGSDVLAKVARERQDLLARLEKLEADLLAEVSKPADKRNAERDRRLKQAEQETKAKLTTLDARIAKEFPSYAELTQPKPLAVAEAQKLLGADEALLLWLVGEKESYLWAVRRDKARFARVEIDRKALEGKVKVLRMGLDPQNIQGTTELPMFRPLLAHELYQLFLAPAEDLLVGAKHLIIVPDGPLQSLPPQVLVTKKPEKPDEEPGKIEWLVRRHAVSVLPAAGALRALRQFAQPPKQREPFAGFGDPVLEGKAGAARGADAKRLFTRGALADVTEVRQMNRLPDTAKELRHIAARLKADPKALHLAEAMTEARIKALDLTRYRLLAFATHGLMAGDFTALAEPGLVATPPAQASEEDDGVLTASEISRLKLNADWVVLFACNTAAADGTPGAEGLSGLARAFFYAGARALFVSHWEVVSDATAYLAMAMLDKEAAGASRAEAHRQAILKMMNEKSRPDFAHPLMWAPFVVVGEGGKR